MMQDKAMSRRTLVKVALSGGLLTALAACVGGQSAESYCTDKGHSQGTAAFEECVQIREAKARRSRSAWGGGSGGSGGS